MIELFLTLDTVAYLSIYAIFDILEEMNIGAKESITKIASAHNEESAQPKVSLWMKLLIKLGLRSECCGAKIYSWHPYKKYCTKCEQKI